jgi:hypothetical protein
MSTSASLPATAVVTLCSASRVSHLRHQLAALAPWGVSRVVVWVGADEPPALDADCVLRVRPGWAGLRLAAARNAGASRALAGGAEFLVFLDADCVPGPDLLASYSAAFTRHSDAVLCGPVTYLPPGADVDDPGVLTEATSPHPARPNPPAGEVRAASTDEYELFWSLSFAIGADAWRRSGGFDEGYEGYGGEDTDFAFALRQIGIGLRWVGGAHAYHQHHQVERPPWRHLDDILRNGARFAAKWGAWPMSGWLEAFAAAGAIRWDGSTWERVGSVR